MKIIDGKDLIAGRLATVVAKMAMQGEIIRIINADKVLISGNQRTTISLYTQKIHRGNALTGPYQPRTADMMLKRIIRGMLPYRKELGDKAFSHIKTYIGVPKEFEGKAETVKEASLSSSKLIKFITLGELSKRIGGIQ
ncbi:MAG TPA: 50S ribosomal protein L13 [Candidatus Nanoarchaeia archaeon]|nr:50S ribosomal protein L13 [Candidatus Nanoarchaeia archaeon]